MLRYLLLFLLLTFPAFAQTKISALPAASALTGVEAFPCVQSAATDKCTVTQAVTFTYSQMSGDCTATSGGVTTCPKSGGVAFAALAFKTQASLTADVSGLLPAANGGSPMTTLGDTIYGGASGLPTRLANGTNGQFFGANTGAAPSWQTPPQGTVTSVGWTGGLISIATPTTTPAFTIAGTSGGLPYFSSASTWASSAALTVNMPILGGGAGAAPFVGTVTGNTTKFATSTGALTSGDCAKWDVNGNIIDAGAACGGGTTNLSTYSTSRYYTLENTAPSAAASAASVANVITCIKGMVLQKLTFSVLTVNITTSGSSNVQSALYNDTNGFPGTLMSSTPSVADTGTVGTAMTLSSSVQTGPGSLWFCTNQNDSTVVFTSVAKTLPGFSGPMIGADVSAAGLATLVSTASGLQGLSCSGAACNGGSSTFGTWPDLTGSTWTRVAATSNAPILFFTPLSVP